MHNSLLPKAFYLSYLYLIPLSLSVCGVSAAFAYTPLPVARSSDLGKVYLAASTGYKGAVLDNDGLVSFTQIKKDVHFYFASGVLETGAREQFNLRLDQGGNLSVNLYDLREDADLLLFDRNGRQVVASSNTLGASAGSIASHLPPGQYNLILRTESRARTAYSLSMYFLEDRPAKSPTLTEHVLSPQAADLETSNAFGPHYAAVDYGVESTGKLLLFLPGTATRALDQRLLMQTATALGYHAIALAYPNDIPITQTEVCGLSANTRCYEQARLEVLKGVDSSDKVAVNASNAIEYRLVRLLEYLQRHYPEQRWSDFLVDGHPNWEQIAISGHSVGGGHAAYIAKQYAVDRVILFANEFDRNLIYDYYAPWLSAPAATPAEKWYGFMHVRDRWEGRLGAWDLLGLDDSIPPIEVDRNRPPYAFSHRLATTFPTKDTREAHLVLTLDAFTPRAKNGSPLFLPAWEYLLGKPFATAAAPQGQVPQEASLAQTPVRVINSTRRAALAASLQ